MRTQAAISADYLLAIYLLAIISGHVHRGTWRSGCKSASDSAREFCWATLDPNSMCRTPGQVLHMARHGCGKQRVQHRVGENLSVEVFLEPVQRLVTASVLVATRHGLNLRDLAP